MSFARTHRRSTARQVAVHLAFALCLLIGLAVSVMTSPAGAQSFPLTGESGAATPRAIAHGVVALPADELAWRVATHDALPVDGATSETFVDGFTVGTDGVLLIADTTTGARDLIGADEASFNVAGADLLVASAGDAATGYARVSLVPSDDREVVTDGDLVLASGPFDAPAQPDGTDGFTLTLYGGDLDTDQTTTFSAGDLTAMLYVTAGSIAVSGADQAVTAGQAIAMSDDTDLTGVDPGSRYVIAAIGPAAPALPAPSVAPSVAPSTAPSVAPSAAPSVPSSGEAPDPTMIVRTWECADVAYWAADLSACQPSDITTWDIGFIDEAGLAGASSFSLADAVIDGQTASWAVDANDDALVFYPIEAPQGYGHVEPVTGAGERTVNVPPGTAEDPATLDLYAFPYGTELGNAGAFDALIQTTDELDYIEDAAPATLSDADGNEIPFATRPRGADGPAVWGDLPLGTYYLDFSGLLADDREVTSISPDVATGTDTPGVYAVSVQTAEYFTLDITIGPVTAPAETSISIGTTRPCLEASVDCTESAGSPLLIDADGNIVPETVTPSTRGDFYIDIPAGTYTIDLSGLDLTGLDLVEVTGDAVATNDPLVYAITVAEGQRADVGFYFESV